MLPINERGVSQIILPLFLLAAIGLAVYLVKQQTELTPSAQEAPNGCTKITPSTRSVRYKNCLSSSTPCNDQTNLIGSNQEQDVDINYIFDGKKVATYALKESVWDFSGGWKNYNTKGPRQADGDRINISKARFDSPNGSKSYLETKSSGETVEYDGGTIVEHVFTTQGTNYQGVSGSRYDPSRSYAFVPSDPNSSTKCNGSGGTTGSKNTGESCTKPSDCKSGICTNLRCAEGSKDNGLSCSNDSECKSGNCGSNKRCQAGTGGSGAQCQNGGDCASGTCTNGKCTTPTPTPSPSRAPAPSTPTTSPLPSPSATASASPLPSGSASPAPSGSPVAISLTKAEIIGFRNSYNALAARIGTATPSGNITVTSNIARSELDSIVAQLPTCPDDANVGKCLDGKFFGRFGYAKTAARLTAFYAIFNNVSGICVKSDFGLQPLITATSQNNTAGRVNLCTEPTAAQKIWRIFVGGKFEPVLSTDTRWPANPSCTTLPQDVTTHYRNAEFIFENQPGFVPNTLCDGKTSFEPPGGNTQP